MIMNKKCEIKESCKNCFFSKPHKAWRVICLRTGKRPDKVCKYFREKEKLDDK